MQSKNQMIKILVSDTAYAQLMSAHTAFSPWVHQTHFEFIPVSKVQVGEDIHVGFISRDVTGKSTKSETLPDTKAFYDRLLNSKCLKWVHIHSAGADRPIYKALTQGGASLTTSFGANAKIVAQTALAAVLALNRNLLPLAQAQRAHQWTPLVGSSIKTLDLEGQRALIVGRGPVGVAITNYLNAVGMHCEQIRFREIQDSPLLSTKGVQSISNEIATHHYTQIEEVLPSVQWLILACPLTPQSKHLIDIHKLSLLPRGAHVINVARGEVMVESDLVLALQSGHLGGAYLDVFEVEPLPKTSPLWDMNNVIVTPHSAGHSQGNEGRVQEQFLNNLVRFLASEPLMHLALI